MTATVIQVEKAEVRFGDCPAAGTPLDPTTLTDFSCQVTSAAITSSSNTTTTTVPATYCQPASEASVPVASSFALDLSFLQDWTAAAGLSAWLFKNDALTKCFALYMKGNDNPVATGQIIAQAGAFGGAPGEPLTADVTLNIQGYPDIKDPSGVSIRPDADPLNLTGATFGATTPAADLATLKADAVYGDGGSSAPASDFTAGQYVILGDASKAHYASSAWVVGAAS